MEHNPYISWILDDIDLDDEQRDQLQDHLAVCTECNALSHSLTSALRSICSAPEQPAPPNFTTKWVALKETRCREQEKKQARTLAIVLGSTALMIALVSLYIFIPGLSLISLTARVISTVMGVLFFFQRVLDLLLGAFHRLDSTTIFFTSLILTGWVILAIFTLGLSIYKVAFRKTVVKK